MYVGGLLIGKFTRSDREARNAVLMALCLEPHVRRDRLAEAFEMSTEALRQMHRQFEAEGLVAVVKRAPGGSKSKLTAAARARIEKMFEKGMSVRDVAAKIKGISRGPIGRIRREWDARRRAAASSAPAPSSATAPVAMMASEQRLFDLSSSGSEVAGAPPVAMALAPQPGEPGAVIDASASAAAREPQDDEPDVAVESAPRAPASSEVEATAPTGASSDEPGTTRTVDGSEDEARGADAVVTPQPIEGGRHVQHVGAWLLIAMVASLGLHQRAAALAENRVTSSALRIALDAVTIALAIGERCVEGVRRIATASAGILLQADHAPSASWVRRVLGRFARDLGGVRLHFGMARTYLEAQREEADGTPIVFYVDNHMRPYTGRAVVRKGWRMQDKRARPGATDYYVHDESGRPVLRVDVPSNAPLTEWLRPIGELLREALE